MSTPLLSVTTPEPERVLDRGVAIGRYVVLALVGRGGMGQVYAAYDPQLDRRVAIKLLRVKARPVAPGDKPSSDSGRARLMREAQAIAKLSHPNVVVVYDVGTFEDQVFIAMEFVDGQTVGFWMNARTRSWTDVLKVFAAAGRGLEAAHDKNFIHRDFKPDNVMIGTDGQVRVMDFGLARSTSNQPPGTDTALSPAVVSDNIGTTSTLVFDATPAPNSKAARTEALSEIFSQQLTQTGAMIGTPAYMAPEQFLMRATDARTDQFSFCVALYEALYGERPFEGTTFFGLTSNVVQGNVRAAPEKSEVPNWIRKLLLRGLSVVPDQRWPSMTALLAALDRKDAAVGRRRFAAGAAAKLTGIWEAPGRKRPADTAAKAAIKRAFLATNKRYAASTFEKVGQTLDRYAAAWTEMYTSACEATHIRREQSTEVLDLRISALQEALQALRALCDAFRVATPQVVEMAVEAANLLPSIERCADVALLRAIVKPPEGAVRAAVERLRGRLAEVRTMVRVGRLAEAVTAIPPLEQEARGTGYTPLVAEVLLERGTVHAERRELETATIKYEEAFWTAEVNRHDEVSAEAATQLVGLLAQQSRFEVADLWAKYAETILDRMGGQERLRGWLFNNVGLMRHMQGRLDESLDCTRRAIALKEKTLGSDNPDLAGSIGNMAFYLSEAGQKEEAILQGLRAISISEAGLGPEHPRIAILLCNLAEALGPLGRFEEARAASRRALTIFERETESDGVYVTCALIPLGLSYLEDGMAVDALPILERAARNRENHESGELARLGEAHFALARALWLATGDYARATVLAERARDEYGRATAIPSTVRALEAIATWLVTHSHN